MAASQPLERRRRGGSRRSTAFSASQRESWPSARPTCSSGTSRNQPPPARASSCGTPVAVSTSARSRPSASRAPRQTSIRATASPPALLAEAAVLVQHQLGRRAAGGQPLLLVLGEVLRRRDDLVALGQLLGAILGALEDVHGLVDHVAVPLDVEDHGRHAGGAQAVLGDLREEAALVGPLALRHAAILANRNAEGAGLGSVGSSRRGG